MKQKHFVIDTNVLLHDPDALFKFPRSHVLLPMTVIEELDSLKRNPTDLGKNARTAIRNLEELKWKGEGNLHKGILIENGATIQIIVEDPPKDLPLIYSVHDNKILLCAYAHKVKGLRVVFVSKDLAARVKAEAIGISAEDYENLKFSYENMYKGISYLKVEKDDIDHFFKDGSLDLPKEKFTSNGYYVLTSPENSSAVARYDASLNKLVPLLKTSPIWGIKPKNVEQRCAIDLLLRDDIRLVTLLGPAGTGKTLLALACGLRKVFDDPTYHRILVTRPIVPLGRDIGYLPGTKEEKLSSWMQPIYDNLEFLCDSIGSEPSETLKWVLESKKLEMEAVTYIRGRTLPQLYMIIDEAQNLTPHEVKTIISRAGDKTKVILAGDPTQIDHPYLDKDSNGLTYTVGKFMNHKIYGSLFLEKTERSELAALAAEIL